MNRKAVFEGRFYPGTREAIFGQLANLGAQGKYALPEIPDGEIIGVVLPHAGHVYSGYQTLPFFKYLKQQEAFPDVFIILNPNHSGIGADVALDPHDTWSNAAGTVTVDTGLADLLPYPADASAQSGEHSAEVIIPYIQYTFPDHAIRILPICIKRQTIEVARKLANDLFHALEVTGKRAVVIASSDFSHYLSPEQGNVNDQLVIDQIENRDIEAVEQTIRRNRISVCGYGPIMTLMYYAGLKDKLYRTTVMARGHSGEVYPSPEVVDYISILFQETH